MLVELYLPHPCVGAATGDWPCLNRERRRADAVESNTLLCRREGRCQSCLDMGGGYLYSLSIVVY